MSTPHASGGGTSNSPEIRAASVNKAISITSIAFTSASPSDVRTGLLGFVSFRIGNSLLVDGVTVRRTRDNRTVLSWPCRTDGLGRRHPYLRPLSDDARRDIEQQVFAALGIDQEAQP